MTKLAWETIELSDDLQSRTDRLNVYGGWIVKTFTVVKVFENNILRTDVRVNTEFVVDPVHHWVCDKIELPSEQTTVTKLPLKKVAKK
jgi:hypothetical protein